MKYMAFDRLTEAILRTKNPSVVGLDPKLSYVPEFIKEEAFELYGRTLKGAARAVLAYNKGIIDAICDIVPAVKPQCAYYEALGPHGMKTLAKTIAYAKKRGMYVIIDGKRNDIGTTMDAYADAHLGKTLVEDISYAPFDGDALTVNGYLGTDGIEPLIKRCDAFGKGIFVLVKTSNPSSGELQDKLIDGLPVYRHMGALCEEWGKHSVGLHGYSACGAVVGATYPEQLAELRIALPHTFFLVPGYGAQGGGAAGVAPAFDERGLGAVVNSSRAVLCAYLKDGDEREYAQAARREAIRMRDDLVAHIPALQQ